MNIEIAKKIMKITEKFSPNCFINSKFELIVEPKNNIYFRLEDVESELELKCRVLSWLSRPSCKGISYHWQDRIRGIVNEYLGTNFTTDEMREIYIHLGNDCNRELSIKFIESNYDLSLLKSIGKEKVEE